MPHIEISDDDFEKLQRISVPLVDTAATAFARVMSHYECIMPLLHTVGSDRTSVVNSYDPASLPPMQHTRLIEGAFNGRMPGRVNWDSLVQCALMDLVGEGLSPAQVKSESTANVVRGVKTSEGYKQLPGCDFSYQGVSAEHAARIIFRSSAHLGCNAWILFRWLDKESAHSPGCYGRAAFSVVDK